MKKIIWTSLLIMAASITAVAQTAIGTTTPDASAAFEISSTTKGFLMPRMTQEQLFDIVNPADGLIVYCLDCVPKGIFVSLDGIFVRFTPDFNTIVTNAFAEVLEDSKSNNNSIKVTYEQLQATGVENLIYDNLARYQGAIASEKYFFTEVSLSELQVLIDSENYTLITSTSGKKWMDRNLGASQVASSSVDALAYGDYYQWGRDRDGHQKGNSDLTSTTATNIEPNHDDFIVSTVWHTASNNTMWSGSTAANNPCPFGLEVPTKANWEAEFSYINAAAGNDAIEKSFNYLKLTAAGSRSRNGDAPVINGDGYYSTASSNNSERMFVISIGSTISSGNQYKSYGYSVRCFKK